MLCRVSISTWGDTSPRVRVKIADRATRLSIVSHIVNGMKMHQQELNKTLDTGTLQHTYLDGVNGHGSWPRLVASIALWRGVRLRSTQVVEPTS
ncbi:hypothetical protein Vadar_003212 [Vaccinium darrowii]|uniref:Uncharacterized protein n=1 Tax=Vaccinium darrowii TaxID=229202 RepID=A0ACB7WXF2_9ERIC|nr:hypothetical protein Vadar_003212 [Vaccinium darrowii]